MTTLATLNSAPQSWSSGAPPRAPMHAMRRKSSRVLRPRFAETVFVAQFASFKSSSRRLAIAQCSPMRRYASAANKVECADADVRTASRRADPSRLDENGEEHGESRAKDVQQRLEHARVGFRRGVVGVGVRQKSRGAAQRIRFPQYVRISGPKSLAHRRRRSNRQGVIFSELSRRQFLDENNAQPHVGFAAVLSAQRSFTRNTSQLGSSSDHNDRAAYFFLLKTRGQTSQSRENFPPPASNSVAAITP